LPALLGVWRTVFSLLLLVLPLRSTAQTISLVPSPQSQDWECQGWGVSLCWWAAQCGQWPEERLDSLVDWLVSPDGLNYNIFRYNIGGGDDPNWTHCSPHHFGAPGGKGLRAEIPGFQDAPGAPYHWERDSAQRRIMLMIKRKRPDAVFEAFSNSAPWWMTISGCCAGNTPATADNVSPQMYEAFAQYLVDVCVHYKEVYGIEFHSLDPFNEPVTDYWYQNGGQEGCHFAVESQIRFLQTLYPILKESGLKTLISAPDETSVHQAIRDIEAYDKAGVLPLVGQWNTHTYKASNESRQRLRHLCDSLGITLWQSETGDGGRGLHGNLMMAQRLVDDIRYLRPSVWCDWQFVEVNFDQWSLVKCDREWGTYQRHANYYVRQHFSRFVPVGYRWLPVDDPHGLLAQSPDGRRLVYITLNTERHKRTLSLLLPQNCRPVQIYRTSRFERCLPVEIPVSSGEVMPLTLPPLSVVTLLFDVNEE